MGRGSGGRGGGGGGGSNANQIGGKGFGGPGAQGVLGRGRAPSAGLCGPAFRASRAVYHHLAQKK